MRGKATTERHFTHCLRMLKRLWENLNSADCIFSDITRQKSAVSPSHSYPHALSLSPKTVTRADLIDSAGNLRESLIWKWGLIVAIAYFDAWVEELVAMLHDNYAAMKAAARAQKYNFDTPSFNENFFTSDKAGVGISFSANNQHLIDFVKWKEARNCLAHKGGQVTKRFADKCIPRAVEGEQWSLSSSDVREAFRAIITFIKEIQRLVRRQVRTQKRLATSPTP